MQRIEWDFYRPENEQDVKDLHAQLEQAVGRKLDLPDLMREPVLAALVGRTDGKITHGMFLEVEAEVCVIGPNPLLPEQTREAEAYFLSVLNRFKIRIVRAHVPRPMVQQAGKKVPALKRILSRLGFTQEDDSQIANFYRWLPADRVPAEEVSTTPAGVTTEIHEAVHG